MSNNQQVLSKSSFMQSSISLDSQDIYKSQSKRLQKVYRKLTSHLLALRQRKIQLLEKIDKAISIKVANSQKIKQIQTVQAKKIQIKRKERQRLLIEQLKNRELTQQKLNSCVQQFKNKHRNANIQAQCNKAVRLQQIIRQNMQLQAQLANLNYRKTQNQINQSYILKDIHDLMAQKSRLETQLIEVSYKRDQKQSFYDLTASQLKAQCANFKQDSQALVVQLFSYHQFDDLSTNDLLKMKSQEQLERQLLFDEIKRLKSELSNMQIQNGLMQSSLNK